MNELQALRHMKSPMDRRAGVWRDGVLQIWVTRSCDKSCFGCTQGSNLAGSSGVMTPEQFKMAVLSLEGYFGVIGVFGGNPATSKYFDDYCDILREYIPFEQRGLWCNNPLGKGRKMRETFNPAYSNLNVHQDVKAFDEFKRDWPESRPFGRDSDSRHSPVFVALKDIIPDEAERWKLIASCDINQQWSALIGVFRGELRAWFCEIAGSQSMLHQRNPSYPDTGHEVVPNWWRKSMVSFRQQVRKHCHECGVPLRGYGQLANGGADQAEQVSRTHLPIYQPKRKGRRIEVVERRAQVEEGSLPTVVDYVGNSSR